MRAWHIPYLICLTVVAICVFVLLVVPAVMTSPLQYTGKVVFESESEYSQFKVAVGHPDVDINEIDVLSSDPPIVVRFDISTPYNMDFNYGTTQGNNGQAVLIGIWYFSLIGIFLIFFPLVATWKGL